MTSSDTDPAKVSMVSFSILSADCRILEEGSPDLQTIHGIEQSKAPCVYPMFVYLEPD